MNGDLRDEKPDRLIFGLRGIVGPKQRGTILKRAKSVYRDGERRIFQRYQAISGGGKAKLFRGNKGIMKEKKPVFDKKTTFLGRQKITLLA